MYLRRVWASHCAFNYTTGQDYFLLLNQVTRATTKTKKIKTVVTFPTTKTIVVGCCSKSDVPKRYTSYTYINKLYVSDGKLINKNNKIYFENRCAFNRNILGHLAGTSSVPLLVKPHAHLIMFKQFFLNVGTVLQKQRYCFYSTSADKDSDDNNHDFVLLAKNVIEAARKIDVMAGSLQLSKVVTLLKELHCQQLPLKQMMDTLSKNLYLLQESESVVKLTELLLSHGLKPDTVVNILENFPVNLENTSFQSIQTLINNSLQHLRIIGFSETNLRSCLALEPKVLFVGSERISSVFSMLKELFTTAHAINVIKNSPNVLSDPSIVTNEKFDYAYFTMGYKQQEIISSRLLSHTLKHIQDRHIFLDRAGFFHPVKEKDDPQLNPNPSLDVVVNSPNNYFAQKFGAINEEEYKAYLAIREVERENENYAEDISDGTDEEKEEEEEYLNTKSKKKHKKK